MNAAIESELRRHVERIVRPVRARWQRKVRMREDLLAHLQAAFAEERLRCGDESEAVRSALRRLGEPETLTRDLQDATPRWDRVAARIQGWYGIGPDESPSRVGFRVMFHTAVLTLASATIVPAIADWAAPNRRAAALGFSFLLTIALWTSAWAGSIVALMAHVGQAQLRGSAHRRGMLVWSLLVATLPLVLPLWSLWLLQTWDTPWFVGSILTSVVSLGIALNAGWFLANELKQRQPWESIDLFAE